MTRLVMMLFATSTLFMATMGLGQSQSVRDACAADLARLCPSAHDPKSASQCMNTYRTDLSDSCRAARKAYRSEQSTNERAADPQPAISSVVSTTSAVAAADKVALPVTDTVASPVETRIAGRAFPSIFQPWNHVENLRALDGTVTPLLNRESPLASQARHDFYWGGWSQLGLKLADGQNYPLLTPVFSPESIQAALRNRATLIAANPNIVILSEVHYKTAPAEYLPPDSPYWARNANVGNNRNLKRYGNQRLDISDPHLQDMVAAFCAALVKSGVYDGCMLDLWHDDDATARDAVSLVRKIRGAVGDRAILVGNVNGRLPTLTASYLNGMYMEGFGAHFFPDWRTAAMNMTWGESHLHKPAITALEGWWQTTGRNDLSLMREVTTLSLVFSNGYVLFSDPNGPPDHLHDWYAFWDKSLGRPVGPLATLNRPDLSGAYTRLYEHGEVVFNPPSNQPASITFPEPRRSSATNTIGRSFTIAPGDGDLFLKLQ